LNADLQNVEKTKMSTFWQQPDAQTQM
jgi:hypothetical protein